MSVPKVNLVMIGHKDHGKSTLIGRLLYDSKAILEEKIKEIKKETQKIGDFQFSYLLDSLEEERTGGLTIDIMHTPFQTDNRLYHIIDCPGHKEFVKNMITGTSQADAAVLVVSATEGVQDQTRQHTYLAKTLGINQLVAVINKMDQVSYQENHYQKTRQELTSFLKDLDYKDVPVVPVSAMNGDNVCHKSENTPWYQGQVLTETLDHAITPKKPPVDKPLRGFVQDTYPYQGQQKILACKIETGTLTTGQKVTLTPSGKTGQLKKILTSTSEKEQAEPGDSVGLLIDTINTAPRGEVLSHPTHQPPTAEKFSAQIILLSDIKLENGDQLTIRYGTARKKCQIHRILEEIDPTQLTTVSQHPKVLTGDSVGKVQFTSLEPLCLEEYSKSPPLGRFVIEGQKGSAAAGIVLSVTETNQQP